MSHTTALPPGCPLAHATVTAKPSTYTLCTLTRRYASGIVGAVHGGSTSFWDDSVMVNGVSGRRHKSHKLNHLSRQAGGGGGGERERLETACATIKE